MIYIKFNLERPKDNERSQVINQERHTLSKAIATEARIGELEEMNHNPPDLQKMKHIIDSYECQSETWSFTG